MRSAGQERLPGDQPRRRLPWLAGGQQQQQRRAPEQGLDEMHVSNPEFMLGQLTVKSISQFFSLTSDEEVLALLGAGAEVP